MPRKKAVPQLPQVQRVTPSIVPGLAPQTPFSPMLQGPATNALTRLSTRMTPPEVDEVTGVGMVRMGPHTFFFDGFNSLIGGLRPSTHKLLDLCVQHLTALNHYRGTGPLHTSVSIALDDFMEAMGIPATKPSKDKARRRVKEDLETLYSLSAEWSEPQGGAVRDFAKTRFCSTVALKSGRIEVDFTPAFTRYLSDAYVMQYPRAIMRISEKFTNSYYLGKRLLLHHSIENNQKKGTAGILSVKSLLDSTPEIPSYETVKNSDRAYTKRIIDPFERDMNALSEILRWSYCNAKGAPLTEQQLQGFDYHTFIACYVQFEVLEFPDPTARLAKKQQHKAAGAPGPKKIPEKGR